MLLSQTPINSSWPEINQIKLKLYYFISGLVDRIYNIPYIYILSFDFSGSCYKTWTARQLNTYYSGGEYTMHKNRVSILSQSDLKRQQRRQAKDYELSQDQVSPCFSHGQKLRRAFPSSCVSLDQSPQHDGSIAMLTLCGASSIVKQLLCNLI